MLDMELTLPRNLLYLIYPYRRTPSSHRIMTSDNSSGQMIIILTKGFVVIVNI